MLDHGNASPIVRGALTADGFLGSARAEGVGAPRAGVRIVVGAAHARRRGQPRHGAAGAGQRVAARSAGSAELYAMGEMLGVSDDNTRVAASRSRCAVACRRRSRSSYSGSFMAYDQQTALYYSPARYLSQSLGLELARYREQGLSFAVRATPGYAWIREPAGTADSTSLDLTAFQFATGLELGYRRGAWDLLLSTGLSSGREGGYRSQNALLYLRRSW